MDIENAIDYNFEEKKGDKREMKKKEVKKKTSIDKLTKKEQEAFIQDVVKNVREEIENCEPIQQNKKDKEMVKVNGLEVLEEVIIKEVKLKGKNGVYNAKTGLGVALESEGCKLAFSTVEEVESFCDEFKEVFERI